MVVFPAPFGPSRQKTSPRATSKLTPRTASVSPYVLRSSLTTTAGSRVAISLSLMRAG